MILINLSHPFTDEQLAAIESLTGMIVDRLIELMPQFDNEEEFAPQVVQLVDSLGLSPREWQTESILLNPPGLAPATAILIAELHGRMGYFPTIVRLRSVERAVIRKYETAEVISLQNIRDCSRATR